MKSITKTYTLTENEKDALSTVIGLLKKLDNEMAVWGGYVGNDKALSYAADKNTIQTLKSTLERLTTINYVTTKDL